MNTYKLKDKVFFKKHGFSIKKGCILGIEVGEFDGITYKIEELEVPYFINFILDIDIISLISEKEKALKKIKNEYINNKKIIKNGNF